MTDGPSYKGAARPIRVRTNTFKADTTGIDQIPGPTYQGKSEGIFVDFKSPPQVDDQTINGPMPDPGTALYRGRSQAVHVFGSDVAAWPVIQPQPACAECNLDFQTNFAGFHITDEDDGYMSASGDGLLIGGGYPGTSTVFPWLIGNDSAGGEVNIAREVVPIQGTPLHPEAIGYLMEFIVPPVTAFAEFQFGAVPYTGDGNRSCFGAVFRGGSSFYVGHIGQTGGNLTGNWGPGDHVMCQLSVIYSSDAGGTYASISASVWNKAFPRSQGRFQSATTTLEWGYNADPLGVGFRYQVLPPHFGSVTVVSVQITSGANCFAPDENCSIWAGLGNTDWTVLDESGGWNGDAGVIAGTWINSGDWSSDGAHVSLHGYILADQVRDGIVAGADFSYDAIRDFGYTPSEFEGSLQASISLTVGGVGTSVVSVAAIDEAGDGAGSTDLEFTNFIFPVGIHLRRGETYHLVVKTDATTKSARLQGGGLLTYNKTVPVTLPTPVQPFGGGVDYFSVTVAISLVSSPGNWGPQPYAIDTGTASITSDGVASVSGSPYCTSPGGGDFGPCEDPALPGVPIPPFKAGYLPTFRRQIGDPTTQLDSFICVFESAAMALDWHTRGAIKVWGGQLIPYSGKTEGQIYGVGANLTDAQHSWRHWSQYFTIRSGNTWTRLMADLGAGRAVELIGDYGVFNLGERCQDNFVDNHAIIILPYQTGDRLLVGDPICHDFRGVRISSLQAYAEAFGAAVYGSHSPQPIAYAVTRPWTPTLP